MYFVYFAVKVLQAEVATGGGGEVVLALRADDCGRLGLMVSGGRLYSAPRTCRRGLLRLSLRESSSLCSSVDLTPSAQAHFRRRARSKPSSSRQRPFAVVVSLYGPRSIMVNSVVYRVKSIQGMRFRQWATRWRTGLECVRQPREVHQEEGAGG